MQGRSFAACAILLIAALVLTAALSLSVYHRSASEFTREKWENAAPNDRMRMLDDLLPKLTVGDTRTKVRQLLGAAEITESDMSAYRLSASPFSDSDWLILNFENETLTGWAVEKRTEAGNE